jgi:hypothetical protein
MMTALGTARELAEESADAVTKLSEQFPESPQVAEVAELSRRLVLKAAALDKEGGA